MSKISNNLMTIDDSEVLDISTNYIVISDAAHFDVE